jgi:hypothetical protein
MNDLTTILRRERWLLGILVYRLTSQAHLQAADDARFLVWAAAEVDDAVARVREADLLRVTLLAGDAAPVRDDAFYEHTDALRDLLLEVRLLSDDVAFPHLEEFLAQVAV